MALLDYVRQLREELERLPDKTVDRSVFRGGRDGDVEELTEEVLKAMGRKFKREGLL